jgi:hypothetical protein
MSRPYGQIQQRPRWNTHDRQEVVLVAQKLKSPLAAVLAVAGALALMSVFGAPIAGATGTPQSAAQLPTSITMTISHAKVSASDVATKRVIILSYIKANGLSKKTVRRAQAHGGCRWIGAGTDVPRYLNSGHSASGGLFWFWDTRHVFECNMRKVKCGNFLRFTVPKRHVIPNNVRVIMVRSFARLRVRIHLLAQAKATCKDNQNTWAKASASLTQTVSLRMFVKTKGASTARLYAKLIDKASAKASAEVQCESTVVIVTPPPSQPPPSCHETGTCPPPPHHFVNISCTGFEEVTGGRSFLVDCDVSNDNGAQITLDAHSNDGNSRVSGINCFSQGGTPSCHGNGTFEFRVTGINDSTNIVSSSITATASSNGVDKTFRSDPFPVDPSCTGFC